MNAYELLQVKAADEWIAYHRIRRTVLFEARGHFNYVTHGPKELKPENLSLLLKYLGTPVGTVRLDTKPEGTGSFR